MILPFRVGRLFFPSIFFFETFLSSCWMLILLWISVTNRLSVCNIKTRKLCECRVQYKEWIVCMIFFPACRSPLQGCRGTKVENYKTRAVFLTFCFRMFCVHYCKKHVTMILCEEFTVQIAFSIFCIFSPSLVDLCCEPGTKKYVCVRSEWDATGVTFSVLKLCYQQLHYMHWSGIFLWPENII